jgi:ArsR family transcriptional regulator
MLWGNNMTNLEYAAVFKALSDEIRLKIVVMLSEDELCACKLLESFSITQPTLSYHMKILCESGIVSSRREGAWMIYSINSRIFKEITDFFHLLITQEGNNYV